MNAGEAAKMTAGMARGVRDLDRQMRPTLDALIKLHGEALHRYRRAMSYGLGFCAALGFVLGWLARGLF